MAEVLAVSLRAGHILLENGANTYRVEESIRRLGLSLGAERMDVVVTPAGIVASTIWGMNHRTRIERVSKVGIGLSRLGAVEDLIARAEEGELNVAELEAELNSLQSSPPVYNRWGVAVGTALGCAALGISFGGSPRDFGVIFLAVFLAQLLRSMLHKTQLGPFLTTALVAAFATEVATVVSRLTDATGITIVASVLLLVPGTLIGSAISDLFNGDTGQALTRAASALLTIVAATAGIWPIVLWMEVTPESLALPGQPDPLIQAAMGALGAIGFAVMFGVPRRFLPGVAVVGLAILFSRTLLLPHVSPELANVVTGIVLSATAAVLTTRVSTPTPLLAVPAYVLLVPGVVFLRGVLNFVSKEYVVGLACFVQAGLVLLAVAIGTAVFGGLTRMRT